MPATKKTSRHFVRLQLSSLSFFYPSVLATLRIGYCQLPGQSVYTKLSERNL
jgi:hypothetical protein